MILELLPIAPPPEPGLPVASYARDADGHLYVRAERGAHAGEWLRRSAVYPEFWQLLGLPGGAARLADILEPPEVVSIRFDFDVDV